MNNGSIGIGCETVTGAKTLELSPYDQQRRPHKAISDSTEIAICPRTLSSELCCPICLDLLTTTMTTKECLHRFCHECITTALLRGNKECPTCRKKLVSKRSLRPDPNFDMLINKIWPDRKVYDTMQERALERFRKQSNVEALQKSIEVGLRDQAAHRRQRVQGSYDYERRKRRPRLIDPATVIASPSTGDQPQNSDDGESTNSPQQPDPHTPSTASASDSNLNTPPLLTPADIELELSPVDELQKRNNLSEHCKQPRYLKTTENATVGHLCEYLALRIGMDESEEECRRLRQETIDSAKVDGADQSHAAPLQPAAPRRLACSIFVQKEDGLEQLDSTTTLREIRHRLRAVRHHRRQLMRLKFDAVVPTAIEPTFEKNEAKIKLKMENDL